MDVTARYYKRFDKVRLRALVIVSLAILLFPLSVSATLVAIPAIASDLSASALYASWIPSIFVLSSLVFQLPGGRLSDLIGLKRAFVWSNIIFALGGVLGALSPTIETLLLSRVVQGAAGAILASTGMAIISRVYESRGRGVAIGWMTSAVYLGMTSGPLVGGVLVDLFGWRSVFLITAPFALLVFVATNRFIKGEWLSAEIHSIDWLGAAIFALAISGLFFGSSHLMELNGLLVVSLSITLLWVFVRRCKRVSNPLVRIDLLIQNTPFIRSVTAALFMYASGYGIILILSLYLQYNRGLSPTEAGQLMMLQALVMTVCAPISGRLSDRLGRRFLATLGCIAISIGLAILTFMDSKMPLSMIAVAIFFVGLGHGIFSTPNNSSALGAIPPQRVGIGSALISLARQSGQLLGTAVVSLLMAIYFGGRAITSADALPLESVAHYALIVSLGMALTAAWFSWRRDI